MKNVMMATQEAMMAARIVCLTQSNSPLIPTRMMNTALSSLDLDEVVYLVDDPALLQFTLTPTSLVNRNSLRFRQSPCPLIDYLHILRK